jgi:hypothetical protein
MSGSQHTWYFTLTVAGGVEVAAMRASARPRADERMTLADGRMLAYCEGATRPAVRSC